MNFCKNGPPYSWRKESVLQLFWGGAVFLREL
jgi:hypothetical protein